MDKQDLCIKILKKGKLWRGESVLGDAGIQWWKRIENE